MSLFVADVIVLVHFLFVIFVPLGGVLALRWPRVAWAHVPAAVWGTLIEFSVVSCPLTPLEKALRVAGGREAYDTGFIQHYIVPLLYPGGLTPAIQISLGIAVIAINAVVYAIVIQRWRSARVASRA